MKRGEPPWWPPGKAPDLEPRAWPWPPRSIDSGAALAKLDELVATAQGLRRKAVNA